MRNWVNVQRTALGVAVLGGGVAAVLAACASADTPSASPLDAGTDAAVVVVPDAGADTGSIVTPDADASEFTVAIGTSYSTACALSNKGRVKCWGDASDGIFLATPEQKKCFDPFAEEGDDPMSDCDPRSPTTLPIPLPVEKLFVGYLSVCVIASENGTKKLGCWGRNGDGRLALPVTEQNDLLTSIHWISLPAAPKRVVDGHRFKVAELEDGSLWAWGDNGYSEFGGPVLGVNEAPVKVWPVEMTVTNGDAGADDAGTDAGSGDASDDAGADAGSGVGMDGGTEDASTDAGAGEGGSTSPVSNIIDIAASRINTYVLAQTGLWMIGDTGHSQAMTLVAPEETDGEFRTWTKLPDDLRNYGDAGAPSTPDPIAKLFHGLRAAGHCYITAAGKAFCWGENAYGQAGSIRAEALDPVSIPELIDLPADKKVVDISIATGHTCAATEDGLAYCWGDHYRGSTGQNSPNTSFFSPQLVSGVSDVAMVRAGTVGFACALTKTQHKVYCWGDNSYGQLASMPDGGSESFSSTPVEIPIVW
jgi:hypothetical protein